MKAISNVKEMNKAARNGGGCTLFTSECDSLVLSLSNLRLLVDHRSDLHKQAVLEIATDANATNLLRIATEIAGFEFSPEPGNIKILRQWIKHGGEEISRLKGPLKDVLEDRMAVSVSWRGSELLEILNEMDALGNETRIWAHADFLSADFVFRNFSYPTDGTASALQLITTSLILAGEFSTPNSEIQKALSFVQQKLDILWSSTNSNQSLRNLSLAVYALRRLLLRREELFDWVSEVVAAGEPEIPSLRFNASLDGFWETLEYGQTTRSSRVASRLCEFKFQGVEPQPMRQLKAALGRWDRVASEVFNPESFSKYLNLPVGVKRDSFFSDARAAHANLFRALAKTLKPDNVPH
jgi:hypothetical protein